MTSLRQSRNFRENALVLTLFFTVVHLLYGKTVQAGFVTDFTGLLGRLDGAPFLGFLTCFGFPAMHQVTNFFLYLLVKCFGTDGLPWYLVFTSLHVANGFLGFRLAKKIFAGSGLGRPAVPALMAALLFLLSPYQADAVTWKVCFNFLFCSLMMLGSLLFLVKFFEQRQRRDLLWSHSLFFLALFTFELAVVLPLLALVLAALRLPLTPPLTPKGGPDGDVDRYTSKSGPTTPKNSMSAGGVDQFISQSGPPLGVRGGVRVRRWASVILSHALLLAFYFLLNKFLLGGWVGHYGEGVHLNFDLQAISANLLKYFSKYLLFWREMPHGYRETLLTFFEKPVVAYSGLALGAVLLVLCIYFFKKMQPNLRAAGLGWLFFFLALAPVSNLHVAWVLQGENDRYGYLASLFFFIGLVALFQFFHRYVRYGLFAAWLMASVFFLHKMTVAWQESALAADGLLEDFRWTDAPQVFVLAFPENYEGVPIFKDFSRQDLGLKHALKYLAGKEPGGAFYQIAQFNMTGPADGVSVEVDSAGVFHVQFNQWGNWWWRHGIGTSDYEVEQYRFSVEGNGSRVELKPSPVAGAVFIYSVGGKWKVIDR